MGEHTISTFSIMFCKMTLNELCQSWGFTLLRPKWQNIAAACWCVPYASSTSWWAVSCLSSLSAQIEGRLIIPGDYAKQQSCLWRREV